MPTTKSSLVERIGNIEHFLLETGVNSVSTGAREAEGKRLQVKNLMLEAKCWRQETEGYKLNAKG